MSTQLEKTRQGQIRDFGGSPAPVWKNSTFERQLSAASILEDEQDSLIELSYIYDVKEYHKALQTLQQWSAGFIWFFLLEELCSTMNVNYINLFEVIKHFRGLAHIGRDPVNI